MRLHNRLCNPVRKQQSAPSRKRADFQEAPQPIFQEIPMQFVHYRDVLNQARQTRKKSRIPLAGWYPAIVLLLVFLASPAHAQFGSSLSGTVLDSTGAAIPNATVALTNTATQQTQTSTSSATGAYHFSELAPGQYSLSVTATGFKKSDLPDVAIEAESPRDVNITLQPGGSTESVEVKGDQIPLLQMSAG